MSENDKPPRQRPECAGCNAKEQCAETCEHCNVGQCTHNLCPLKCGGV